MTTKVSAARSWTRPGAAALTLETALLVLAALLRFYRLDGQLGLDEIAALHVYRRTLWSILTEFPGFFPNPLYDALAHLALRLFGDTPLAIRLPAALFGVASVIAFYRLACRIVARGEALLVGTLMAVSFHHIFFSQSALGYTAVLFFALLATHLALTLRRRMTPGGAAAYAGVAALAAYAHPFGAFVPAGQLIVLSVAPRSNAVTGDNPSRVHLAALVVITYLLILALYAPFIRDGVAVRLLTGRAAGYGVGLSGVLQEIFASIRAIGGWVGVAVISFVGAFGALDLLFRRPLAIGLMAMPIALSAATVAILGIGVHARYFLFLLPLAYLAATRGLVLIGRAVLRLVPVAPQRRSVLETVLAIATVLIAAVPLVRYYAVPKQDFRGALRLAQSLAAPDDRVVAATYAGHAIQSHYDPSIAVVEDVQQLEGVEAAAQRVWVITTLERVMDRATPTLVERLHEGYRLVRALPGTLGDGTMRIYLWERNPSGRSRP